MDGTGPTAIVSGVADGGLYGDSQEVRIVYQAVDPASGIATVAGTMDGAAYPSGRLQPLYDLELGMHELTVSATDKAGQLSKPTHQKLSNKLDAARVSAASGNDKRALQQLAALRELAVDTTLVPDADVRAVLTRDIDALTAVID